MQRIIGDILVGLFHLPNDVKLTYVAYIDLLKQNMHTWFKEKPLFFRKKMGFIHNSASHAVKLTSNFLATIGIKCEKFMTWPACSIDLNTVENIWAMLKRRIYEFGHQFS